MFRKTLPAMGLVMGSLLAAQSHSALAAGQQITFTNGMDVGIREMYCAAGPTETGKGFSGPVPAESSVKIEASRIPDDVDCSRLYVIMDNGAGWQFYFEPALGAASEVSLDWDQVSAHAAPDERYPSLLIELPDDAYVTPAGLPLVAVVQGIQFGMQESDWQGFAVPQAADAGQYAVMFADTSWSLTPQGITYSDEMVDGMRLASAIEFTAPFANTTISAAFSRIRQLGCLPWLFQHHDSSSAFADEGVNLDPGARPLEGMDSDEARWSALENMLQAAEGTTGSVRMVFGNEDVQIELELDLDTGKAILRVVRNESAAFG